MVCADGCLGVQCGTCFMFSRQQTQIRHILYLPGISTVDAELGVLGRRKSLRKYLRLIFLWIAGVLGGASLYKHT